MALGVGAAVGLISPSPTGRSERIWRCYPGQMPAAPLIPRGSSQDTSQPGKPGPRRASESRTRKPRAGPRDRVPGSAWALMGRRHQPLPARRAGTRPGLYLPGNFPETALTPRGASLEAGCILGSPLQRRGRGLGHRRPSPGAPGPASRRGRPAHGFPRRPHYRLPGRRLSRPHRAHEEAEAQRGPRSTQGHTAGRWQGWGLKPACGPNPPPHLCLWEGSRMKSSPGPGPPDPLIRTTW